MLTGSSESTHVKMPHCWKSHVAAHMFSFQYYGYRERLKHLGREDEVEHLNRTALRIARDIADKSGKLMAGNLSNTPFYDPDDRKMDEKIMEMFKVLYKYHSNTPRLYSQWLNSVIYWLINHCTDWARTNVTSFCRQFDFHDVIYHNRRRNAVFAAT